MWQLVAVLLREETLAATSGTHIGPAQRDERWLPRVATRLGLAQRNVGVDGQQLASGLLGGIDYSSDDGSFGNLLNDLECRGDWRAWKFVECIAPDNDEAMAGVAEIAVQWNGMVDDAENG